MGNNEWIDLTVDNDQTRIFYRHDSLLGTQVFHQLEQRSRGVRELDRVALTDAEALAFARQLPEVQALVEAARHLAGNLPEAALLDAEDMWGFTNTQVVREWRDLVFHALAPFEEASDE